MGGQELAFVKRRTTNLFVTLGVLGCGDGVSETPLDLVAVAMEHEYPEVAAPVPTAPVGNLPAEPGRPSLDFANPVDPHRRIGFERQYIAGLTDRPMEAIDWYDHGAGVALLDFDGDGDLDVFVGTSFESRPACLLRNESEPRLFRFEEERCFPELEWAAGGFGVDSNRDGLHELVITGPRLARHIDLVTGEETDLLQFENAYEGCAAGAVASHDIDWDGQPDLFIGCHAPIPARGVVPNFALRGFGDGTWAEFPYRVGGTSANENTLALGVIDIDDDGALDLVTIDDTYSTDGARQTFNFPGGIRRRCAPTDDCLDELWHFSATASRWGSFMGVGNLHVEGVGDALYLADWGVNRLVRFGEGDPEDLMDESGLAYGYVDAGELPFRFGFDDRLPLFSWGVLVDDFDFDGRDDVFVTQGLVPALPGENAFGYHFPMIGLQTESGHFDLLVAIAGVDVPTRADAYPADHPASSRGIAKADLDGDGVMELLVAPQAGFVQVYSEADPLGVAPARCTIIPENWAVPSFGFGYAVDEGNGFRRRDMQGQLLTGTSPWVLTSARSGIFRFPSGYVAEFECDEDNQVVVTEPPWIQLDATETQVLVEVARSDVGLVEVFGRAASGDARLLGSGEPPRFSIERGEADQLVLRVDGKWVPRWWTL